MIDSTSTKSGIVLVSCVPAFSIVYSSNRLHNRRSQFPELLCVEAALSAQNTVALSQDTVLLSGEHISVVAGHISGVRGKICRRGNDHT